MSPPSNQFQMDDQALEAFHSLFSSPKYEIYNTHIAAVDFIERDDLEDLSQILQDITDQDEEPALADVTINDIRFYSQQWDILQSPSEKFDYVKIQVLHYRENVHQAAFLLLLAEVSEEEVTNRLGTKENLASHKLQTDLADIWHSIFPPELPGMVTKLSRRNRRNLSDRDRLTAPVTLSSTQVLVDGIDELRGYPDDGDDLTDYEPFIENIRNRDFTDRFGLNHTFPASLTQSFDDSFVLIYALSQGMVNYELQFDKFAFLQFIDRDSDMLVNHIGWNQFSRGVPLYPNNPPGRVMIRSLPFLYYLFYFFRVPISIEDHEERLRQQPFELSDGRNLDEYISMLQNVESGFYSDYVTFLDNTDAALSLVESHREEFAQTAYFKRIPKEDESSEESPGVFDIFTDELESDIEGLSERYERVQKRYDTLTDRLNRQLNLEISQQNKSLTESSVDLQEETRDLTESSNDLQKDVSSLEGVIE